MVLGMLVLYCSSTEHSISFSFCLSVRSCSIGLFSLLLFLLQFSFVYGKLLVDLFSFVVSVCLNRIREIFSISFVCSYV